MNAQEAITLCRLAKGMCPQQAFDEYTPDAWLMLLDDLRFVDCHDALKELGKRQKFIAPNEIRTEVKRIRADRIDKFGPVDPPPEVQSGERDYHEWLGSVRRAIADGELTPETRAINKGERKRVDLAIEPAFGRVPRA